MTIDTQTTSGLARAATPAGAGERPVKSGESGGEAALTSDFETFLRMLTVQMQNQDPLNPMESSDFAVQLATFSGVEQQVLTNDLLAGLAAGMGAASGLSDYAAWVGMDVRSAAPVTLTGAPVQLALLPHPEAASGELVVRDQTGTIVQELAVPQGAESLTWDGSAFGTPGLPPGTYTVAVRWSDGEGTLAEWPAESYQTVTEVRQAPGGAVEVVLRNGAAVPAEGVTAVRGA